MFLYASVMFRSLLSVVRFIFCFRFVLYYDVLCFCHFSQFAFFFRLSFVLCFVYVEFLLQNWIMLYFSSLFLLYVSALFVFICFPLCVWLIKIVLCSVFFLCFCYVWYVDLFLLCFLLCFYVSFAIMFRFYYMYVLCWVPICFPLWFLLGFCLYVLWQHQVCSSIGQSLEFANSAGYLSWEVCNYIVS